VAGHFKVTMTTAQYADLLNAILLLIPAADEVGKLTGGQRWSNSIVGKAVGLVSAAETIVDIGIAGLDVLPDTDRLRAQLIAIVPGLELIFPPSVS